VTLRVAALQAERGGSVQVLGSVRAGAKVCGAVSVDIRLVNPDGSERLLARLNTDAGGAFQGPIVIPPWVSLGAQRFRAALSPGEDCGFRAALGGIR
jgi:hypothetical protein